MKFYGLFTSVFMLKCLLISLVVPFLDCLKIRIGDQGIIAVCNRPTERVMCGKKGLLSKTSASKSP